MKLRRRPRRGFAQTAASGWAESTHAEVAWGRSRSAALRWGAAGAVLGALVALVAYAPAAWLAARLESATQGRLLLADARGTVWNGSAVAVLTGGPGSRDAASLPGRLEWTLGLHGLALELRARHDCCLNGTLALRITPGLGRATVALVPGAAGPVGQWPTAWLGGLGTPWNTMKLGGTVRLVSPGLAAELVQGRVRLSGRADVELVGVSSRVTTLPALGSYRLGIAADGSAAGTAALTLATQEGALQLSGNGTWGAAGVRFRGEATAAPGDEPALANLLNIIGRRDGARSVISIG